MVNSIDNYIRQLKSRRNGMDRFGVVAEDEQRSIFVNSLTKEAWEDKAAGKPYTRYAIGSMQEVSPTYTRVSVETAGRVINQLKNRLEANGYSVDFRLQGSVPLNVHIRGVSDVDLLTFDDSFITYDVAGSKSLRGGYVNPTAKTSLGVLSSLRAEIEKVLPQAFPAATIDSGDKAVKLSGGSLARPVDVVPAHWHDNVSYQQSGLETHRGVSILSRSGPSVVGNLPFLHIELITVRCTQVFGGLRKAIRLCKNVKADAESEGRNINFPSFDIAATMYHADMQALRLGIVFELAVLAETQRYLDLLATDHQYAKTLWVPDGSRLIFDTPGKLAGLNALSLEMDNLVRQVAKENDQRFRAVTTPLLSESRDAIKGLVY